MARVLSALVCAALVFALAPAALAEGAPVAFLHDPPAQAVEGERVEIIGELYGAALVQTATVRWRGFGEKEWHAALLLPAGGLLVRAVLAGERVKRPALEYWVEGLGLTGKKFPLFGAASETQLVQVVDPSDLQTPRLAATPRPVIVPKDPASGRSRDEPSPEKLVVIEARPVEAAPIPEAAAPGTRRRKATSSHLTLFFPEQPATLAAGRPQKLTEALGSITALGEDELKTLGVRTAADALRLIPNLDAGRDVQGFHRAAVRGLRDDAGILVLYDGHRLNNPYDGRALLEIPVENLERIEVQTGPGSALLGPGALLATVNIVPRRRDGISFAADGTTLKQGAIHFHGGGQIQGWQMDGDVDLSGGTGLTTAIPHDALTDALVTQGLLAATQEAGLVDDRTSQLNAGTRVVAPKLAGGELELKLRYLHQRRGLYLGLYDVVGGDVSNGGGTESQIRREILLGDLSWKRSLNDTLALQLSLSGDQRDEERAAALAPPNYAVGTVTYSRGIHVRELWTARNLGAEATLEAHPGPLWRGHATLGVRREQLAFYEPAADVTTTGAPLSELRVPTVPLAQLDASLNARTDLYGLVHAEVAPHPALALVAGLRIDSLSGQGTATDAACVPPACSLGKRPSWLLVSPRAGLSFTALPSLRLKLLYGHGARAPTLEELARQILQPATLRHDTLAGDQELKPAQTDSLDLIADWSDLLSFGRASLRFDAFYLRAKDVIEPPPAGDVATFINDPGALTSLGAGLEARVEKSRRFFARLSAGFQLAQDTAFSEGALRDVASFTAALGGGLPLGPWLNLSLLAQARSGRQNSQRTPLEVGRAYELPATLLVSATLRSEPIFNVAEAALSAQNIVGTEQRDDVPRPEEVTGLLPREGRLISLVVRARF